MFFCIGFFAAFAILFAGCNGKNRAYSTATIDSSTLATVDTTSIDGVSINFWDTLTLSERAIIINEIRQEIIAWETEEGDRVTNVNIEVIVNNDITNTVEVESSPKEIVIACKRPFKIPRGHLHKHLCKWHKKKCKRNGQD